MQASSSTDVMNHPFWEYSPDSKFTVYMTHSLSPHIYIYIYVYTKMRVKAKLLVRGVRQMKFNEIPDILQNG